MNYDVGQDVEDGFDFDQSPKPFLKTTILPAEDEDERITRPVWTSATGGRYAAAVTESRCSLFPALLREDLLDLKELLQNRDVLFRIGLQSWRKFFCASEEIWGEWTALGAAVLIGNATLVEELLKVWPDDSTAESTLYIDDVSTFYLPCHSHNTISMTPLELAAFVGNQPILELFLPLKLNFTNQDVVFSLLWSFANGHKQLAMRLMKDLRGSPLRCVDRQGTPLFFYACIGGIAMVNFYLEKIGNDKREWNLPKTKQGRSAIHWAVSGVQIEVVEWLIQQDGGECSIAAEDDRGWNVFHFLCNSPRGNENKKIDLLKLLKRESQLSLDKATANKNETPLSLACFRQQFNVVKELLKMGASNRLSPKAGSNLARKFLSDKNLNVPTALGKLGVRISALTCLSNEKLYPDSCSASFDTFVSSNFISHETVNCLQWACWCGTVVSLEKLIDDGVGSIEERGEKNKTPIWYCSSLSNLEFMVSRGANIGIDKEAGLFLLHRFGSRPSSKVDDTVWMEMVKYLLDCGIPIEMENESGQKAHEEAKGEMRIYLYSKYTLHCFKQLDEEQVKPLWTQLCIVGNQMAGKTTLTNSLQSAAAPEKPPPSRLKRLFKTLKRKMKRSPNPAIIDIDDRTAGVDIHNMNIPGVGLMSVWDFGGHYSFLVAHAILFSFSLTVFVLVIDLCHENGKRKSPSEIKEEARYWIAFVLSSRKILLLSSGKIPFAVIFNNKSGRRRSSRNGVCASFHWAMEELMEEFGSVVDLKIVLELSCIESYSPEMNNLREQLQSLRNDVIENAELVPKVCERIRYLILTHLSRVDDVATRFLTEAEFAKEVEKCLERDVFAVLPVHRLSAYLHDTGTILHFLKLNRVFLRPSVLVTNVVGPLLSPRYFRISAIPNKSGIVTRNEIARALERFQQMRRDKGCPCAVLTAEEAIAVMLDLDLVCVDQGAAESYQIPSLIEAGEPENVWDISTELTFYRGRRFSVSNTKTAIFPPSFFPVLQCRVRGFRNCRSNLWKAGVKLVPASGLYAECLVRTSERSSFVDFQVRCARGHENSASHLLHCAMAAAESVQRDRCSGTSMIWYYLDSSVLARHQNASIPIYEEDDVKNCCLGGYVTSPCEGHPRITVNDLVFPAEEASNPITFPYSVARDNLTKPFVNAAASVACVKWEEICCLLLSTNDLAEIKEHLKSNVSRLLAVIERWSLACSASCRPVAEEFIQACVHAGVAERAIKEAYEKYNPAPL